MATALEQEFHYYVEHQAELVKKYEGLFVVILGEDVVGAYTNEFDAITAMKAKGYSLGTFLVQKCDPGEANYTQIFRSRDRFAKT